jgi:hypothetical protein
MALETGFYFVVGNKGPRLASNNEHNVTSSLQKVAVRMTSCCKWGNGRKADSFYTTVIFYIHF